MNKLAFDHKRQVDGFLEKIGSAEHTQMSSNMSRLVRSHIRENSFAEKILVPEVPEASEVRPSTIPQDDTLEILIYKEPDARAQFITQRGTPYSEYLYADKVAIPFGVLASRKYEKTEDELRAYRGIDLPGLVEAHSAKAVGDMQDAYLLGMARQAVANNGLDLSSAGEPFTKDVLITLMNAPHQAQLRPTISLMTETTFNNFARQTANDVGDSFASEVVINGMKVKQLLGFPVITTLKNYLLNDNEIFSFPAPEFLGKFLVLDKEKFVVTKRDGVVSWYSKKTIAMMLVNINGVVRMKLNNFAG